VDPNRAPSWPADYAERKAGAGCPLCASLGQVGDDETLTVAELEWTEVRLQRRSRLPGFCTVVWRGAHVAEPTELPPEASAGYWAEVAAVGRAIEAGFEPVKLNLFTLGNLVPHLHTHVVPRYPADPAPGALIPWDDMFRPEPIPGAELDAQRARLRAHLLG